MRVPVIVTTWAHVLILSVALVLAGVIVARSRPRVVSVATPCTLGPLEGVPDDVAPCPPLGTSAREPVLVDTILGPRLAYWAGGRWREISGEPMLLAVRAWRALP